MRALGRTNRIGWAGVAILVLAGCSCEEVLGLPNCPALACFPSTAVLFERPIDEPGAYEVVATLEPGTVEVRCRLELERRPSGLHAVREDCDPSPIGSSFLRPAEDAAVPLAFEGIGTTGRFGSGLLVITRNGVEIARDSLEVDSVQPHANPRCFPDCTRTILKKRD